MDVEGAEWKVLSHLLSSAQLADGLARVGQLALEVHLWGPRGPRSHLNLDSGISSRHLKSWMAVLKALKTRGGLSKLSHRINPHSSTEHVGFDSPTPCCHELTLMRPGGRPGKR